MPVLGCVADDITGATDMAGALAMEGMRTIVQFDPDKKIAPEAFDAVVIALKSRMAPPDEAVRTSRAALCALKRMGCERFYFKYCSTFDSRDTGNIGPVIDALLKEIPAPFVLVCPATPDNGRTVYQSNLFVHEKPLSESSMRNHPLTPMMDSNLARLLAPQSRSAIGSIYLQTIRKGSDATRLAIRELQTERKQVVIADAIDDTDLNTLVSATIDNALLTGAAGLAKAIPNVLRANGMLHSDRSMPALNWPNGDSAILSGSCSEMTQAQVQHARRHMPVFEVDVLRIADGTCCVEDILAWTRPIIARGPFLISATANPDTVRSAQQRLGPTKAGSLVEGLLACVARGLVREGVRRLVVAGGETSGAVVNALGIVALQIGPQIDAGVHWSMSLGQTPIALALKSGNFGSEDFFTKAWDFL